MATTLAPNLNLNLPAILGWLGERIAEERRRWPSSSLGADRTSLYAGGLRASRPRPAEQLDAAYAMRLSRTDKQVLDLIADWPFCTVEQLAGLMGGVGRRRVNQALRRLRRLVERDKAGGGYVLSDEGLTALARRDRAAVGPVLDRWTPQRHEGVYIGTSLRSLASQRDHQRGIVGFAARLSAEVAEQPDEYELFDLLPTHRSQISYDAEGARQLLLPDASFQQVHLGDFEWCLFEYERRATHAAPAAHTAAFVRALLQEPLRRQRPQRVTAAGGCSCSSRRVPRMSFSLPPPGCPGCRWPAPRRRCLMSTGCSGRPGCCPLRMHRNADSWSTCGN